jgi:CHAD domain-containing protein
MTEQRQCYGILKKLSVQQVVRGLEKMGYSCETEGIRQALYTYYDTQDGKLYNRSLRLRCCTREADNNVNSGAVKNGVSARTSTSADYDPTWQLIRDGRLLLTQETENDAIPQIGVIADHIAGITGPGSLLPYLVARMTEQEVSLHAPNPIADEVSEEGVEGGGGQSGSTASGPPMLLRFENWRFKSPFREPWSVPYMVMTTSAGVENKEGEYLHTLLRDYIGLRPVDFDVLENGLHIVDGALPGTPVPPRCKLSSGDSVYTAIGKTSGKQIYKMWGNTEGTIHDLDIEFLHDLRVATRRMRFSLLLFKEYVGKTRTENLRKELSWIAKSLGRVRDIDVFQEKFSVQFRRIGASEDLIERVVGHYTGKRYKNLETLKADLKSDRYKNLIEALRKLETYMMRKGRGQGVPVVELIPGFIDEVLDRMSGWFGRSADSLSPNDLHDLRIEFKGLRYTNEFFSDLYAGDMRKVIRGFVQFQDCLGLYQDAQVASQMLRKFSQKAMKKGTASVDMILGLGGLIQVQREIQEQQQGRFLGMWNEFPRQIKELRKLLRTGKYYNRVL